MPLSQPPPQLRGFTLIELMIVVAIVGILAAIAFPSYRNYVIKSHRAVAKSALSEMAARQEAFLADRKTYATTSLAQLGYPAATTYLLGGKDYASSSSNAIYSLAISTGATATTYTITATPLGSQTRDTDCAILGIDNVGRKTASGPKGSACWQ